ncbi:MAG: nucleoside-diphosphate sugar epimerase/dehydratase, partial [Gaiellales bacterium]
MPLLRRHRLWQIAVDAALIAGAWYLAFALRFDKGVPPVYDTYWRRTILIVVGVKLGILLLSGWYVKWWRYISLRDVQVLARSVLLASVVLWVAFEIFTPVGDKRLPLGIAVLDLLLTLMGLAGVRVVARSLIERPRPGSLVPRGKEVLVVGAGDAGGLVLREMLTTRLAGYTPIGLVDDDPRKRHMRLHGVKVLGTTADLPRLLRERKPDEVHLAIPSAAGETRNRIVAACRAARVPVRTLPAVHELLDGDSNLLRQLREVRVEDVLGRDPVQLDPEEIGSYVRGRVVLVTGAGGSIGSELCRQIARMSPARIVLLDHAETNLFQIERELVERGTTNIVPVIGDVKDIGKLDRLFVGYRPGVVFHAAAYKHVPLMQANPLEAIRNNAIATRTLARIAAKHGTQRFVLISTDKAVNAQTVMGATKALCEWVVEAISQEPGSMVAVAVRFGNVLASSGSVVPIFRRQIAAGGPVTVTHAGMTRFFMTIPEAAQLVVQAGGAAQGGEIFVLDMGEPVKIIDLARDMIRLSGLEPDRDIAIEVVGIRPGEKLDEDLFEQWETVQPTAHAKVRRATRPTIDASWLEERLDSLERLSLEGDTLR